MNYKCFANHQRGFSHVKKEMECQDYSDCYIDEEKRFYIFCACDGHSDNNCFRSSKGAKYGCEAAITILRRFFELYYADEKDDIIDSCEEVQLRLKRAVKQYWDDKIFEDLHQNPITEEEMKFLSEGIRAYYQSGKGHENIYGATLLAVAISEDIAISLNIGDGILLFVDEDGNYYEPLPADEKGDTGSPASLCDSDLFTRERAFRCAFSKKIPQVAFVSTDGIGDCMDWIEFREFIHSFVQKLQSMEMTDTSPHLNEPQLQYLQSCVKYYADKGNGVEDDCSLAGIYDLDTDIPEVKIPLEKAYSLWEEVYQEREKMLRNYQSRKSSIEEDILHESSKRISPKTDTISFIKAKEKLEQLKEIYRNIVRNEAQKIDYFDHRLKTFEEHILRAGGKLEAGRKQFEPQEVKKEYLKQNFLYEKLIFAYHDWNEKILQEQKMSIQKQDLDRQVQVGKEKISNVREFEEKVEADLKLEALNRTQTKLLNDYETLLKETEEAKKNFYEIYSEVLEKERD